MVRRDVPVVLLVPRNTALLVRLARGAKFPKNNATEEALQPIFVPHHVSVRQGIVEMPKKATGLLFKVTIFTELFLPIPLNTGHISHRKGVKKVKKKPFALLGKS